MNNDIEIQAQNYTNKVQLLENHFLRFYRSHQWQVPSVQLDVFSRYWSLAFINGHQSKVLIEREGNKIPLRGHQCIFIPQFSLIKWHILSHELNWIGYFSDLPLLNFSVNEAIAFPYTGELPQTLQDAQYLLIHASEIKKVGQTTSDSLVKKLKLMIDQSYSENVSLQIMAENLNCSKETLIRRFKQAYGLSPIQYRLKLRLAEAVGSLMLEPMSIGQIAHKSGFNDVSFFNKVFRRELKTTPSSYQRFR